MQRHREYLPFSSPLCYQFNQCITGNWKIILIRIEAWSILHGTIFMHWWVKTTAKHKQLRQGIWQYPVEEQNKKLQKYKEHDSSLRITQAKRCSFTGQARRKKDLFNSLMHVNGWWSTVRRCKILPWACFGMLKTRIL